LDVGGERAGDNEDYCKEEGSSIDKTAAENFGERGKDHRSWALLVQLSIVWNWGDLPSPKPTTKMEMLTRANSSETSNSFCTPAMSAVMTEDANATTKHVTATTMVQYHLYALDQFFGFSGSFGLNVTSL